jgi:predicted O-methyltransferase YrrM
MNQETWSAVEDYFSQMVVRPDAALEAAAAASQQAGLPPIAVAPPEGKLLHLLARLTGAKRILEIGTLAGYSTIWLARALAPGGKLVTLEIDLKHAAIAEENIARAGLAGVVDLRLGPALETLPRLEAEGIGPFDLTFIDADKPSNPDYFRWALKLSRPGSLIIVDNVVRKGRVVEADSGDENVEGVRRMLELIAAEKRVSATVLQTVSSKGYDGFVVALVNG